MTRGRFPHPPRPQKPLDPSDPATGFTEWCDAERIALFGRGPLKRVWIAARRYSREQAERDRRRDG